MKIGLTNSRTSFGRSAFTLAEVLIAVAAVGLVFVTLYMGLSFSFAVTRAGRENLRATQIILERLEGIRLFTWDQVQNPALNPTSFTESFTSSGSGKNIIYTGSMKITPSPVMNPTSTYGPKVLMITVTVSWPSGGRTITKSMSTYVSKFGVQNYVYDN